MPNSGTTRFLALCGVVAPILFTILVLIGGLIQPNYSHIREPISALGATGTPSAPIQQTNFMITGLLIIAFSIGLYRGIKDGKAAKVGSAFVFIIGAGVVGGGVFSCDPGCPETGSFTNTMHLVDAFPTFIAMFVAPLIIWRALKNNARWQNHRTYTLATGVVLLILFPPLFPAFIASPWGGALQRLYVGIVWLWLGITAMRLRITQQSS